MDFLLDTRFVVGLVVGAAILFLWQKRSQPKPGM